MDLDFEDMIPLQSVIPRCKETETQQDQEPLKPNNEWNEKSSTNSVKTNRKTLKRKIIRAKSKSQKLHLTAVNNNLKPKKTKEDHKLQSKKNILENEFLIKDGANDTQESPVNLELSHIMHDELEQDNDPTDRNVTNTDCEVLTLMFDNKGKMSQRQLLTENDVKSGFIQDTLEEITLTEFDYQVGQDVIDSLFTESFSDDTQNCSNNMGTRESQISKDISGNHSQTVQVILDHQVLQLSPNNDALSCPNHDQEPLEDYTPILSELIPDDDMRLFLEKQDTLNNESRSLTWFKNKEDIHYVEDKENASNTTKSQNLHPLSNGVQEKVDSNSDKLSLCFEQNAHNNQSCSSLPLENSEMSDQNVDSGENLSNAAKSQNLHPMDNKVKEKIDSSSEMVSPCDKKSLDRDRKFSCQKCGHVSTRLAMYLAHFRACNNVIKTLNCNCCEFETEDKDVLLSHWKFMHGESKNLTRTGRKILYHDRTKSKTHKSTLDKKKRLNSEGSTVNKKCKLCGLQFTNKKDYLLHEETIHQNHTSYFCDYCPHRTFNKRSLYTHVYQNHPNHSFRRYLRKNFKCKHCGINFTDQEKYYLHQESEHQIKRSFHCNLCPHQSFTSIIFNQHMKHIHNQDIPEVSTKDEIMRTNPKISITDKTESIKEQKDMEKPFSCEYRGMKRRYLTDHIRRNHKNSKAVAVPCKSEYKLVDEPPSADISSSNEQVENESSNENQFDMTGDQKSEKFSCQQCSYIGLKRSNLAAHVRWNHKNKKIDLKKLSSTSKEETGKISPVRKITNATSLSKIPTDHTSGKNVSSMQPSKKIIKESQIENYRLTQSVKVIKKKFSCKNCTYKSIRKKDLIVHHRRMHRTKRIFQKSSSKVVKQKKMCAKNNQSLHRQTSMNLRFPRQVKETSDISKKNLQKQKHKDCIDKANNVKPPKARSTRSKCQKEEILYSHKEKVKRHFHCSICSYRATVAKDLESHLSNVHKKQHLKIF